MPMAYEDRAAARLREIAAVVGCPIEAFYLPRDADSVMTEELLRLWNATTDTQARQRILNTARREAASEVGMPEAAA
jgi:hypothetical protein